MNNDFITAFTLWRDFIIRNLKRAMESLPQLLHLS